MSNEQKSGGVEITSPCETKKQIESKEQFKQLLKSGDWGLMFKALQIKDEEETIDFTEEIRKVFIDYLYHYDFSNAVWMIERIKDIDFKQEISSQPNNDTIIIGFQKLLEQEKVSDAADAQKLLPLHNFTDQIKTAFTRLLSNKQMTGAAEINRRWGNKFGDIEIKKYEEQIKKGFKKLLSDERIRDAIAVHQQFKGEGKIDFTEEIKQHAEEI